MADIVFADRVEFFEDQDIMEVDFHDVTFDLSRQVNDVYDELDRRARETGRKWYFLVNYRNCHIMAEAWIAFHHRGKLLNLAYSIGSVRFAADDETSEAILERSRKEDFDPNLFPSRETAVARIRELRSEVTDATFAKLRKLPRRPAAPSFAKRVTFHPDQQIMEVDFSGLTFADFRTVDEFYDAIDRRVERAGGKWFFMVNYQGCEILPDAWVTFASRGKRLNLARSLGSVRYAAPLDTADAIREDSQKEKFDASLFSSREAALARIAELRAGATA